MLGCVASRTSSIGRLICSSEEGRRLRRSDKRTSIKKPATLDLDTEWKWFEVCGEKLVYFGKKVAKAIGMNMPCILKWDLSQKKMRSRISQSNKILTKDKFQASHQVN